MRPKGSKKTPGSGRKKNAPNKNIIPLREKCEELGIDPFEVLLLYADGRWKELGFESESYTKYGAQGVTNEELYIPAGLRAKAAADAAQYIYPKLKAIDHTVGEVTVKVHMSDEDLKAIDRSIEDEF